MTSARLQCWGGGGARQQAGAKALSAVLKGAVRTRHAASCSLPPHSIGDAQFGKWGWGGCLSGGLEWVVRQAPYPTSFWSSHPVAHTCRTLRRYSVSSVDSHHRRHVGVAMEAHPETQT